MFMFIPACLGGVYVYVCVCVYIYIYIHTYICICTSSETLLTVQIYDKHIEILAQKLNSGTIFFMIL